MIGSLCRVDGPLHSCMYVLRSLALQLTSSCEALKQAASCFGYSKYEQPLQNFKPDSVRLK